jgi:hypothetical protein
MYLFAVRKRSKPGEVLYGDPLSDAAICGLFACKRLA